MAGRVATRTLRTALSLTRQSRLSPSLSRTMVYVAPDSASKPEPKKSATAADMTAEDLDQLPSRRNATTTNNGNGNGNGNNAITTNNGHSWVEGSGDGSPTDWSRSFHGLSSQPFDKEISDILLTPVDPIDIEVKPGMLLFANAALGSNPEMSHRRPDLPSRDQIPPHSQQSFRPWWVGPRPSKRDERWTKGGQQGVCACLPWQVPTKTPLSICDMLKFWRVISRLVAVARGEQEYFDPSGIPTATEACKSNALMRCCKDLGIASELWLVTGTSRASVR